MKIAHVGILSLSMGLLTNVSTADSVPVAEDHSCFFCTMEVALVGDLYHWDSWSSSGADGQVDGPMHFNLHESGCFDWAVHDPCEQELQDELADAVLENDSAQLLQLVASTDGQVALNQERGAVQLWSCEGDRIVAHFQIDAQLMANLIEATDR